MTREDRITTAWLAPLAAVLVIGWLFRADRCLDDELADRVGTVDPPAVTVAPPSNLEPDAVVVDNPYSMHTCNYWPRKIDYWINDGILVAILLFIGFLSGRKFRQRARTRAAVITFTSLVVALTFQQLVRGQNLWSVILHDKSQLLVLLLVFSGAAAIACLAAHFTLKLRSR